MPAVSKQDIIDWIEERFPKAIVHSIEEAHPRLNLPVKITVVGISQAEQLFIHEELSRELPVGIRIDVHRKDPPCETCNGMGRILTRHDSTGGQVCQACGGDGIQGHRAEDFSDKHRGSHRPISRADTPWAMED
jgi:hypothetical protein